LLLLLLLAVIVFAVIHNNNAKAAAAKRKLTAVKPSVSATVATATRGSIGIYLDAIGTVTPVYTASITAQASGVLTSVHYREGQYVQKGEALIDIDPRPYQAQLMQAEGALERDTNILAQARMDLDRYRTAWAGNGINKQLLDDQEKIVLQDQGTVKNDQGTVNYDRVQLGYCHPCRSTPGGPRECGAGIGSHGAGGRHPGAADYRDLHHAGGQSSPGAGSDAPGAHTAHRRVGSRTDRQVSNG
jgi:multidrug efflux system membrane fusion protein